MSNDAFMLAIIAGSVARAAGQPESACHHPSGSAGAICWRYGYRHHGLPAEETVARETRRNGRGSSILGPRTEWPGVQLRELEILLAAEMSQKLIATVLIRSHQSVRKKVWELRQARAAA